MKPTAYEQILSVLIELKEAFPSYNLGRHLDTALDDYKDIWGMTDKELAFVMDKYKTKLEMDVPHTDESEIDKIIKEGMDLDNILKEEDEDYGDNY
jgi:hypothetical protein